jgi:hypothetical protein
MPLSMPCRPKAARYGSAFRQIAAWHEEMS